MTSRADVDAFLLTQPPVLRPQIEALGYSALCHLAEVGDVPGWAYPCGFSVRWFPTRGIAKRRWYQERQRLLCQVGGPGVYALGPKPEATSLLDAYIWGGGSLS
jgi:hypothetical protein